MSIGPASNLELKSTKSDSARIFSNTKPKSSGAKLHVSWKDIKNAKTSYNILLSMPRLFIKIKVRI